MGLLPRAPPPDRTGPRAPCAPRAPLTPGPPRPPRIPGLGTPVPRNPCSPRAPRPGTPARPESLRTGGPVHSTRPLAVRGPAWGALPLAEPTLGVAFASCRRSGAETRGLSGSRDSCACHLAAREKQEVGRDKLCVKGAQRWTRTTGETRPSPANCGR